MSYGKATPFLPLADLVRHYFRIESRDDVRSIRVKVTGGLLTLDESLKDVVPIVLWLLDALPEDSPLRILEPAERRRRTLAAVKRVLLRESDIRPLVLVFEDLHWIDGETQAFLDSFIDSVPAARLLLAVNYRPEYLHSWANKTYYRQLRVDPLANDSAEDLLGVLLGHDSSVEALKPMLIRRSEGTPLFLEESVRMLAEAGALVGERGAYRLVQTPDVLQVPATVQAILAARIDRLEPEDKRLLQAAAVVGAHVPFVLLQAVMDVDDDALRAGLARLQTAELVHESRLFPELEYAFRHALTHEVAYGGVLNARRQTLHGVLVEAIERVYAERLAEQVERLAHHAARAGEPSKAIRYLKEAGLKAASQFANREASAHFEQAQKLLDGLPENAQALGERLAILLAYGPVLIAIKGPHSTEVEALYLGAQALVDRLEASASRFPVLWSLWYVRFSRAQYLEALQAGERLLETARAGNSDVELLEAHHALWPTLNAMGRPLQAMHHAEQGIVLYDRERHATQRFVYGGHDPGTCCRAHLAMARWSAGYPDQALRYQQDGLRLATELDHPITTVLMSYFAGWVHYQRGELEPAMALFETVRSVATRFEITRYPQYSEVLLRCESGHPKDLEELDALHKVLDSIPPSWQKMFCACVLARACARSGRAGHGLVLLRSFASESVGTSYEVEVLRTEGELMLQHEPSDANGVEQKFREAISLAHLREQRSMELRAATSLGRHLLDCGRRAEASDALAGICSWFTEGLCTADLKSARAVLAERIER